MSKPNDQKLTRRDFVADAGEASSALAPSPPHFPMIVPRHVLGGKGYVAPSSMSEHRGGRRWRARESATRGSVASREPRRVLRRRSGVHGTQRHGRAASAATARSPSPETRRLPRQVSEGDEVRRLPRDAREAERTSTRIIVATPDHMHATVAAAAMRARKARLRAEAADLVRVRASRLLQVGSPRRTSVVTQMGNQGHSSDGTRRVVGVDPRRRHRSGVAKCTSAPNRPARLSGPQRVRAATPRRACDPAPTLGTWQSVRAVKQRAARQHSATRDPIPCPTGLRWDLYLGPVAEDVRVSPGLSPVQRGAAGWTSACGALGDMGAHLIDQPYLGARPHAVRRASKRRRRCGAR